MDFFQTLNKLLLSLHYSDWIDKAPYIVLVGECGIGKSTLVEKLTGETGRSSSSSSNVSFTQNDEYFWVPDKSLQIADTPGLDLIKANIDHKVKIGNAFKFRKVSKFFIVVESNVHKREVMKKIEEFFDQLIGLPSEVIGVIVTKMDIEREWTKQEFSADCDEQLEISDIVYSSENKSGKDLLADIHKVCGEPESLTFKLKSSNPNFVSPKKQKPVVAPKPNKALEVPQTSPDLSTDGNQIRNRKNHFITESLFAESIFLNYLMKLKYWMNSLHLVL